MPPKRAITVEQRRELRAWAKKQRPKASQKACIEWFEQRLGSRLKQCTISESLSTRYSHLDTFDPDAFNDKKRVRNRTARWPEVESTLFAFQKRMEAQNGLTSDAELQLRAKAIWVAMPEKEEAECPEFSLGWLARFRARFNIKRHTRHREASSVPESAAEDMEAICLIAEGYQEGDIYNMDETRLYWRMTPSRGLSSQSLPGIKKDKTRITLIFCGNADGTDRFPYGSLGVLGFPEAFEMSTSRRWEQCRGGTRRLG